MMFFSGSASRGELIVYGKVIGAKPNHFLDSLLSFLETIHFLTCKGDHKKERELLPLISLGATTDLIV